MDMLCFPVSVFPCPVPKQNVLSMWQSTTGLVTHDLDAQKALVTKFGGECCYPARML